jgi:hypothetical protein
MVDGEMRLADDARAKAYSMSREAFHPGDLLPIRIVA